MKENYENPVQLAKNIQKKNNKKIKINSQNLQNQDKKKDQVQNKSEIEQQKVQKQVELILWNINLDKKQLEKLENHPKNKGLNQDNKTQSNNSDGWNQELSLSALKKAYNYQKKKKVLENRIQENQKKHQQLLQKEKQQIEQQKQQQIKEKKLKAKVRRMKRFDNIIRISKEIYKYREQKNMITTQKQNNIKYKAVPAHTLDFELVEKKKVKKSKIKLALQEFQKQKSYKEDDIIQNNTDKLSEQIITDEEIKQNNIKDTKISNNFDEEDNYQTIAEMTENETHITKNHIQYQNNQIKNYLTGTKYNMMTLRHWVDHEPCQELDQKVIQFVNQLSYKQAMKKLQTPLKFKKRIVAGFKECMKTLKLNLNEFKSKCVILPLNLQENPGKGGSDEIVQEILTLCKQKNIPVFHASSRARLGNAFRGKFGCRIGCLSIINYQSMEDQFMEMLEMLSMQQKLFHDNNLHNI